MKFRLPSASVHRRFLKNSFPNKHRAQHSCNGMFTVCHSNMTKKKLYWNNYLFVTKDTKTSLSQCLVTTSRKCKWIIMNYLTHSETQPLVTSVSSSAASENSMRVYAPSCFTFQHSKYHTTNNARIFHSKQSFQQGEKKWRHETNEHWIKSTIVHSRIRSAGIK